MTAEPPVPDFPVRFGLVGYGAGGRLFHAPFISAAAGCELTAIVARSEQRKSQAESDYPGTPLFPSLDDMLDRVPLDVVVITTPPTTHVALISRALERGLAVVGDKPFAPDPASARHLVHQADAKGLLLGAYHNRRWDADIRTLKNVCDNFTIGKPRVFESRFDLWQPETIEGGPGGGVLNDLGSHLIDQALWLWGPASHVYAEIVEFDTITGPSDSGFFVSISHQNGTISHLQATKTALPPKRSLHVTAANGTFHIDSSDVQATAVGQGLRPATTSRWGYDVAATVTTAEGESTVPSSQGSYSAYYEQFARAVRGNDTLPVPGREAVAVLELIDAARRSAELRQVSELASSDHDFGPPLPNTTTEHSDLGPTVTRIAADDLAKPDTDLS